MQYGAKGILSQFPDTPRGFPEPAVSCKTIKCISAKAAKIKGKTKCNEKNLFNVALFTEKPPQMTK